MLGVPNNSFSFSCAKGDSTFEVILDLHDDFENSYKENLDVKKDWIIEITLANRIRKKLIIEDVKISLKKNTENVASQNKYPKWLGYVTGVISGLIIGIILGIILFLSSLIKKSRPKIIRRWLKKDEKLRVRIDSSSY